jgi:hypothetical protein
VILSLTLVLDKTVGAEVGREEGIVYPGDEGVVSEPGKLEADRVDS